MAVAVTVTACGRAEQKPDGGGSMAGGPAGETGGRSSGGSGGDAAGSDSTQGGAGQTGGGAGIHGMAADGGGGTAGGSCPNGSCASGGAGRSGASGEAGKGGTSGIDTGGTAGQGVGEGGMSDSGSAGMGATGGVPTDVLDPGLPTPSHDCRTDTTGDCVSLAGTYDGMPVDEVILEADCSGAAVHAGKWPIACDRVGGDPNARVLLDVPIVRPGSYYLAISPDDRAGVDFQYTVDFTNTIALFAGNLVSAELAYTVVVTSAPYRTVSGTFHGIWSDPDSACLSLGSSACGTAELNVTFRSSTRYGSCFDDTECVAPATCDPVGLICF